MVGMKRICAKSVRADPFIAFLGDQQFHHAVFAAVFMETGGEMGAKSSRPGDFKAVVDGVDAHELESVLQQQTQRFRGVAMPAMPRIQHDAHVVPILPGHGVYVDLTKERAVAAI